MSWSKPVYSTNVSEVGWDDEAKALVVTFKNGRVYAYQGADEQKADELSKAASVTDMLNNEIKGQYPFKRIR